jgi:hypothetical protein
VQGDVKTGISSGIIFLREGVQEQKVCFSKSPSIEDRDELNHLRIS